MLYYETIEDMAAGVFNIKEGERVIIIAEGYVYSVKNTGGFLKFFRETPSGWRYLYTIKV
jgi:hypothetical protein